MVLLLLFSQVETLWSFDWGFFKANYDLVSVCRDSTENVYIYTEESPFPVKYLFFLGNQLYAITDGAIYASTYSASDGVGKWGLISDTCFLGQIEDVDAKNLSVIKALVVTTSGGAYVSLDGGLMWGSNNGILGDKNVKAGVVVPDTQSSVMGYIVIGTEKGYVYISNRVAPFQNWYLLSRKMFDTYAGEETYDSIPSGWTENQIEDEALFDIRLDSLDGAQLLMLLGSHTEDTTREAVSISRAFEPVEGIEWRFYFFTGEAGHSFTQDTIYDTVIVQDGDTFYFDTLFVNQQEVYNSGPEFLVYDEDGNVVAEVGLIDGKMSYFSPEEGWKSLYQMEKGSGYHVKIEAFDGKGKIFVNDISVGEFALLSSGSIARVEYLSLIHI